MPKFILILFIILQIGFSAKVFSQEKTNGIDLQDVSIPDVLHVLAKAMHQNIIINPNINGVVSIHLHHMTASEAFNLLLISHNLAKKIIGHTWLIVPKNMLMQSQQEDMKLKEILDDTDILQTRIWQIRYAKAEDISHLLQDNNSSLLSKRGHVKIDSRTNMVCIQDTPSHLIEVQKIINRLDIPVQQVVIEARLASIDNNYEREIGVHFSVQSPEVEKNAETTSAPLTHYSLAVATMADSSLLDVQLAALENEGHGELISSPSLFTANQQTASIESGEEIPYQEVSRGGGTAVAFKKAVLSLKVTPQIMPNKKVLLQLQVNQDRPSSQFVQGVPAISTRQMSTSVLINNGQTIVLGGIFETNQAQTEHGLPFLDKIPLVGWLFKQQNVQRNKRELLIFVTPKIIPQIR